MSWDYKFKFRIDPDVPRFNLDFSRGYIGAVKVLGIPIAGAITQDQIYAALAQYVADNPGALAGLTDDIKAALLQIAEKVAYIDEHGQDYYDALVAAFTAVTYVGLNKSTVTFTSVGATEQLTATTLPAGASVSWASSDTSVATVSNTGLVTSVAGGTATITATAGSLTASCSVAVELPTVASISAVYTQSGTVYDTDSLDSLKADLVVTATYSDSSTATVPSADYTLSGTLTVGTSTITVTYAGQTDTFDVTVTAIPTVSWSYTSGRVPSENDDGIKTTTQGSVSVSFDADKGMYVTGGTNNSSYARFEPVTYTTMKKGYCEAVFTVTAASDTAAVNPRCSNGTSGWSVLVTKTNQDGQVVAYKKTTATNILTGTTWVVNTEYTLRIEYDESGKNRIYLNGVQIFETTEMSTYYTTFNRLFVQGAISAYVKSIKWVIEDS